MVQSKAVSVQDYMLEVSPDRRPALDRLRAMCLATFGADSEHMAYGMPAYGDPDRVRAAFNSQKQHIAFYPGPKALEAVSARLAGIDHGKGCVRWRRPEKMDFDLIADILADIRDRDLNGCY